MAKIWIKRAVDLEQKRPSSFFITQFDWPLKFKRCLRSVVISEVSTFSRGRGVNRGSSETMRPSVSRGAIVVFLGADMRRPDRPEAVAAALGHHFAIGSVLALDGEHLVEFGAWRVDRIANVVLLAGHGQDVE
jgi:hypothetical protein